MALAWATTGGAELLCALPSPACWPSCTQLGAHHHGTCGLALVFVWMKDGANSHPAELLAAGFAAGFLPLLTAQCCCLVFGEQLVGNHEASSD